MRKTLKILHTLGSCGLIGGLAVYMVLLALAPLDAPGDYAAHRRMIAMIGNYVLIPSLGICLVTGLVAIAVHRPFQERRWVWVKAALGIGMFEGTMGLVQSKADYADRLTRAADGAAAVAALAADLAYEWPLLAVIMVLSIFNVVLGVWRPALKRRSAA